MKILFNFAHNYFLTAQKINTKTAYEVGGFDKVYEFSMNDIDREFYNSNLSLLSHEKGAGWWLWKYYFINKLLNDDSIPEGSKIMYVDSGSEFINSIDPLFEVFDRDNNEVMVFRQLHRSYIWTHSDCFFEVLGYNPYDLENHPEGFNYTHSNQFVGGMWIAKKGDFARKFYAETLEHAQKARVLPEGPNIHGIPNHPQFREHRHDESLVSIMAKKYKLYPYRNCLHTGIEDDINWTNNEYTDESFARAVAKFGDPSTWSSYTWGGDFKLYPDIKFDDKSTYPTLLNLTRRKH